MTQTPRSTYHHGDLRAALVTAALARLESGEPLSLRAVARDVGVSQAAPYRHFPDRDHLEAAVAVVGFDELEGRLRTEMSRPGWTVADLCVVYVRSALERPALFRAMFGRPCDTGDDDRVAAVAALHRLIDDAVAAAAADTPAATGTQGTPNPLATAVWALAHGLAMLHLDGKFPADAPEAVDARVRSAVAALLPS